MSAQSILYQSNETATGTVQGRINSNTIGDNAVAGSACSTTNCGGIAVNHNDAGGNTNTSALRVTISGNTIQQIQNGFGISVFGSGAGTAHTLIAVNTLRSPAGTTINQREAIDVHYATQAASSVAVCTHITGNLIENAAGLNWGEGISGAAIHLRQRNGVNVGLQGYGGLVFEMLQVQSLVSGNNGFATVLAESDGFPLGYINTTCTTPP